MKIKTGQTIYELVVSVDLDNNPISAATFSDYFYIDGTLTSSIIPDINLVNDSTATFSISWSAQTLGNHQVYLKNDLTNVIYISEIYNVLPDNEVDPSPTIYVGL